MSGFKVFSSDQDLDDVFLPRYDLDPSTALVNYITPSGQNLSELYLPYSSGRKAPATGFKLYNPLNLSNNIDLSDLFAYNYYGFKTTYASDLESVKIRTSIVFGTEYVAVTFNSLSNQYYYKQGNPTANARYTAGTFTVIDVTKIQNAKVILVSGGGGGGVGIAEYGTGANPASGGGGGAVHFLDVSFVNKTSFLVEVGNGGVGAFRNGSSVRTPPSRGGSGKITLTNGTAIINNVAYTTNDFFDASNNGYMGQNIYNNNLPYSTFSLDNATDSDVDANVGAGSGGGGGAWSNYSTILRSGGPGNPGSNGGSVLSSVDCAGGGGGGGISAIPIDRTVNTNASGLFFGNGGNGGNGMLIKTSGFGSTYYGGGGGAAQKTFGSVGATSGFLLQGNGGLGGGGTAYRIVTAVSGGATGGSGINGLGGGGGGISATQVSNATDVNPRQAGAGGHGTVIFTFNIVGPPITNIAGVWTPLGTGVNNEVRGISSIDPSNVYITGTFTQANGSAFNYLAKWDGSSWSTVGPGGLNWDTLAVSILDASNIYFGGKFGQAIIPGDVYWANFIIRWTGSTWAELGSGNNNDNDYGVSYYVFAIHALNSTNIYLTGQFTGAGNANSIPVSRVARWTGTTWSALGSGLNGIGRAIWAVDTSNVYVGGDFTAAGGVANTAYLGKWDGSAWSALGTGVNNTVLAISALDASNVYVGGDFTTANGITVNRIAKWDGSSWSALGSGTNGTVCAIHAYDATNIIVGGYFTTAGGITCNRVAKWNGSSWSAFGSGTVGVNSYVNAVHVASPTTIYAGGAFTTAGGVSCNRIAMFTAT